ncbi:MAG: hypothetical protein D6705_18580 [Deltaproteobacteria bacterium]|nr:MAG: hypothetical protein D6705_18580 [Deltaproteobacteria bacterium]
MGRPHVEAYPDLESLWKRVRSAVGGHPAAEEIVLGATVEGRPLRAVRMGRSAAPAVLLVAGIHGNELFGPRLAAAFVADLVSDAGRPLRDDADVWVVPVANPDGYARTVRRRGRGPLSALRTNARGVDLNRNFPLPTGCRRPPWPGAGADRIGAATYRGPAPLSEPESRALADLSRRIRPVVAASLHTFMGTLIPAYTPDRTDHRRYARLCRVFADAQRRHRYVRLAHRVLDGATGEFEDFLHHDLGCFAVCVESYPVWASLRAVPWPTTPGQRFLPADPTPWIENDCPALLALFRAGLELARAGLRPHALGTQA